MSLSDCKAGENEEKSELGIWRTNNFALGRSHSKCSNGIFPTIARFNHSCIPSAEFCWNEKAGKQEIRAIRNIRAQEEITLCYFTSQWQLEDSDVRRHYLLEYYGFCCTCRACELTGKYFTLASDHFVVELLAKFAKSSQRLLKYLVKFAFHPLFFIKSVR